MSNTNKGPPVSSIIDRVNGIQTVFKANPGIKVLSFEQNGGASRDGVVPYWSSHMDGAKSERIVPSGHGAHQDPQAIQEVLRILTLNAR